MAKKQYFGEEVKTTEEKKTRKARQKPKRKYTRRAVKTEGAEMVTIEVPASLAYQIGLQIGQAMA